MRQRRLARRVERRESTERREDRRRRIGCRASRYRCRRQGREQLRPRHAESQQQALGRREQRRVERAREPRVERDASIGLQKAEVQVDVRSSQKRQRGEYRSFVDMENGKCKREQSSLRRRFSTRRVKSRCQESDRSAARKFTCPNSLFPQIFSGNMPIYKK